MRIDRYTRAARTFYNLNRWICIRIDALGGLFAAALASYLVYFQGHSAANTGFSLNMAGMSVQILGFLTFNTTTNLISWIQRNDSLVGTSLE